MTTRPVHVVVVNYAGWRDTIECLESVLRSDYPDLVTILVDNASPDDSRHELDLWARRWFGQAGQFTVVPRTEFEAGRVGGAFRLIIVHNETNLGFAGACNIGLSHVMKAQADSWVLLLNSDATIAADAITQMVGAAERLFPFGSLGAMGATILRQNRPQVEMLGGATVRRWNAMVRRAGAEIDAGADRPATVRLDYVSGCCLLTSGDVVRRVGLMDDQFFLYSEDVDWGLRMQKHGLRLSYCPTAEVRHKGGGSVVHRSPVHDYYMVRAALMLVRKHAPAMVPAALVYWFARGILPKLARREWSRLRAASKGYRDFLMQMIRPMKAAAS